MKNRALILSILFLLGCRQREIEFNLPYDGDKLIVYAIFSPNEPLSVKLTKTYPPVGQVIYIYIKDAEVLVYEDGKFLERLKYEKDDNYISETGYKPKVGSKYSLKVNAVGFPSVETNEEVIPTKPNVTYFDFSQDIESALNDWKKAKKLILKLKDEEEKQNFFLLNGYAYWNNQKTGISTGFGISQPNEFILPCLNFYIGSAIINNDCFQNNSYTYERGYEIDRFFMGYSTQRVQKMEFFVRQINKSYYDFCKTYYEEEDLLKAFNSPNPRYSNIKGGYGIFSAYNEVKFEALIK
ncbi:MAG: DUF4249 domain-containing protein [Spirosomataceae bacterium]